MAVVQVFKRVEKKYMLSKDALSRLYPVLLEHMSEDKYGQHTICNIYYDTDDYELIRTSIEKPSYKEKFRVRSYGVPAEDDIVFLEIKKKNAGVVYKRRIPFKYSEAMEVLRLISGGRLVGNDVGERLGLDSYGNIQILHEIEYIINHYGLFPKSYIAYDRIALFGMDEPELRITLDKNIRERFYDLTLIAGDHGEKILGDDMYLMEIKTNGAMPLWLAKLLTDMGIYPYSFSKYANAYKREILEVY